jgi:iron complex outermembrane receptor protein
MAFDDYTFSLQNLYVCNPIKGVLLSSIQYSKEAATKKLFLQADFSLSEKLHLETGLAFNTTRYSCEIFCSSGNTNLVIPWEVWSPRAGLPIDLQNKTIYASISKGFSTTVSETLTPMGD